MTYVGGKMFPVKIQINSKGIYGDWRFYKEELDYIPFELPPNIKYSITKLMDMLQLNFGGIDLALVNGEYYFIEVNPTGEWGWLEVKTHTPISVAIKRHFAGRVNYDSRNYSSYSTEKIN